MHDVDCAYMFSLGITIGLEGLQAAQDVTTTVRRNLSHHKATEAVCPALTGATLSSGRRLTAESLMTSHRRP